MPSRLDPTITHTLLSTPLPVPPIPISLKPFHPYLTPKIAEAQLHPVIESLLHILNNDLTSAHFFVRKLQGAVPVREYDIHPNGNDVTKTMGANGGRIEEHMKRNGAGRGQRSGAIPPKIEGMFLHAIIHRLEGDYENARAWYNDVKSKSEEWQHENIEGNEDVKKDVFIHVHAAGSESPDSYLNDLIQYRTQHEPSYARAHPQLSRQLPTSTNSINNSSLAKASNKDAEHERLRAWHEAELRRTWEWCEQRFGLGRWEQAEGEFVDEQDEKYRVMAQGQVVGGEGWRKF